MKVFIGKGAFLLLSHALPREELCLLSIDRGACGGRQTRYAFNRQTSQCVPFDYTGCGGNLNNFVSMMDCMATCGNVGFRR